VSSSQDSLKKVQMYDSYIKKSLRFFARQCFKKKKKLLEREVCFSELPLKTLATLACYDSYFEDDYAFDVLGTRVKFSKTELFKALSMLSQQKREVIILSVGLGLKDTEVAERLNLTKENARFHRLTALEILREFMGVLPDEEK